MRAGEGFCGECRQECEVYASVISWDYAGTHCTGGRPGTHVEGTDFLSRCCDAEAYENEDLTIEFEPEDPADYGPDTYDEESGIA